jgi:hypothetical protein
MNDLLENKRAYLLELVAKAQERMNTLKEAVETTNANDAGIDLCFAIEDTITPLNIALEIAEQL